MPAGGGVKDVTRGTWPNEDDLIKDIGRSGVKVARHRRRATSWRIQKEEAKARRTKKEAGKGKLSQKASQKEKAKLAEEHVGGNAKGSIASTSMYGVNL